MIDSSGGGGGSGRAGRTATGRSDELACSRCSGEDNELGTASVDGEKGRDDVKQVVEIESSRNIEEGGSGWLTGVGIRR